MRICFLLFQYFPHGGLQRDFRAMADACVRRGHEVTVLTMRWQGPKPAGYAVEQVPAQGWTNHGRCLRFARAAQERCRTSGFDLVVGFNKLQGLDFYFAADPCHRVKAHRDRGWFYRRSGRYRAWTELEASVFAPSSTTSILVLSEELKRNYMEAWGTPGDRFHVLPPGISPDRRAPANAAEIRNAFRNEWNIEPQNWVVLMVGSGYKTKGLDRAIRALAALPESERNRTWLFVVGRGQARPFTRLAARLGVGSRLKLVGGRDDILRFMLGADVLLHPARTETYGMVLLEAMASGLPVLVSEECGYATHVSQAHAGLVIPAPFHQTALDSLLVRMLDRSAQNRWRKAGLDYIARTDVFSLPERAVDLFESVRKGKCGRGD